MLTKKLKISLKIKLFLTVALSVFILVLFLTYYAVSQMTDLIARGESDQSHLLIESIRSRMDQQLEAARISVLSLANNTEVQRVFAEREREELAAMLQPSFEAIRDEVAQVQFHLPDSTSFLRLHMPENYGDSLRDFRFTVNEANDNRRIVSGLEEGRGGFGFRVVVPMFFGEEHTGSVEYGSDFGEFFLSGLKESYGGEFFIYPFEQTGVSWNQEGGGSGALAATAIEDRWPIEERHLQDLRSGIPVITNSADEKYRVVLIPFDNYRGESSGFIKVVNDRHHILAQMQETRTVMIVLSALGIALVSLLMLLLVHLSLKAVPEMVRTVKSMAEGDFTVRAAVSSGDEIGQIAEHVNCSIEALNETLLRVKSSSDLVYHTSTEISTGNQDLSQRTEEQASSLEEISSTIEQVASSLESSSANAVQADTLSSRTMKSVQQGETVVSELQGAMGEITTGSQEISEIIAKVNDIAFQTNLLALNAAVEAARAGEQGRGFAVVASEVRNLAGRSSESAMEIEKLIKDSILKVENGNKLMGETERILKEIVENTRKTSDVVGEIAASLSEQSTASAEIRSAVEELNQVTQQNAALVEEIASSSENMESEATDLSGTIDTFKLAE